MTVAEPLTPYDRNRLLATAEHREPATPPRSASGDAALPLRLLAVPPCSVSPLPDKDFIVRSTTCRPGTAPLGIDCGRHPSCVV
ncbi:hypothetical protein [Duncaniella dubosii]|uniref:hypothetical protein n=1 Tax=Duncaniella dubosii TaxID=2518971 RepID=UPI0023EFDCDF|nr:hypothetical protein [Duncaniella dubosii]MCX4285574.1 hypothetical protein [Duncaniella dubosii]